MIIICPDALRALTGKKSSSVRKDAAALPAALELLVHDNTDDYTSEEGGGSWVTFFMWFLVQEIRKLLNRNNEDTPFFSFSRDWALDQARFDEIPDENVRAIIIGFTNACYTMWKDNHVTVPAHNEVRADCREFCEGCEVEGAWTEVQAEGQPTELEFTCEEDCDAFQDHVSDEIGNRTNNDEAALKRMFKTYMEECGHLIKMPELPPMKLPKFGPPPFNYGRDPFSWDSLIAKTVPKPKPKADPNVFIGYNAGIMVAPETGTWT